MSLACANCAGALTDQAVICHACTGRLTTDLQTTPVVLDSLDVTLTRQDVITKGAGNGEKPLPYHAKASTVAGQIRAVLYGWAKVLLEEGGDDYDAADWAEADRTPAPWLAHRVGDIRMREWAADLTRELREALDEADVCMDRYEERLYAGPCGNHLDDGGPDCATMLWAPLDAEHITCPTCLAQWNVDDRRDKLITSAKGKYLDPKRAASLVTLMTRQRVTAPLIHALAADQHIHADELIYALTGDLIYRVGDILDALKYRDDHKPATATQVIAWLRDIYDIDLGPTGRARLIKHAQRNPADIHRYDDGTYRRLDVLVLARRWLERQDEAA